MMGASHESDPTLRATVAAIDQRRRARAARAKVADLAPYAAGLGLLLAVLLYRLIQQRRNRQVLK